MTFYVFYLAIKGLFTCIFPISPTEHRPSICSNVFLQLVQLDISMYERFGTVEALENQYTNWMIPYLSQKVNNPSFERKFGVFVYGHTIAIAR